MCECFCSILQDSQRNIRKMVPIKKQAGSFPNFFPSSLALVVSSVLSCSFYVLDQRTISDVDVLEMTWKDGLVVLYP